jgi:ATP-dependent RNA helicase SUPV3L1/SUV3
MQKVSLIKAGSVEHVRLQRFLGWAYENVPQFIERHTHSQDWCSQYVSKGNPRVSLAAKSFYLGLSPSAVAKLDQDYEESTTLGRILSVDTKPYRFAVNVLGIQKGFLIDSVLKVLAPDIATHIQDTESPEGLQIALDKALSAIVLRHLAFIYDLPSGCKLKASDLIERAPEDIRDLEAFASKMISEINKNRPGMQYEVRLTENDFSMTLQRTVPDDYDAVLSDNEVATYRKDDTAALQRKFDLISKSAYDIPLATLGEDFILELLGFTEKRIPKTLAAHRETFQEKNAFAVLLKDPRFQEYHKLYPARKLTRQWIANLGPTNSGKTHDAIQALAGCRRGIYLSPLRLMALENQERLEQMGVPCSLITGEEEIIREGATHFSATVEEFARFRDESWDVIIIDEVQMLADPKRGWAWIDALVSANTPKLMLTGPALIEPSLQTLAAICGDTIEIVRKQRLSPVEVAKHPITLQGLDKGSLVVAFSRRTVLELKGVLEASGRTVSVVYGALSPDVRREQARRFRDGEADIMVATDAVGMGLNLPARTLCFYADEKYDGLENRLLNVQEVKQIGGRAGRFGMAESGIITAFDQKTLKTIKRLFHEDDQVIDLSQFQVRPSFDHLQIISEELGEKRLLNAWKIFIRNINFGDEFVAVLPDELAEWIELIDVPEYPLALRWIFACTPVRGGLEGLASQHALRWLDDICAKKTIALPHIQTSSDLNSMETGLHVIETYIHLARGLVEFFPDHEKAKEVRAQLNDSITKALSRKRAPTKADKRVLQGGQKRCEKCKTALPLLSSAQRLCQTCWTRTH